MIFLPSYARFTSWFRLAMLAFVFITSFFAAPDAFAARKKYTSRAQTDDISKYAAIVIDATTGEVLKADNPDKPLHPASLTKMMTMLLVFDALAEGRMRATDYIRISNHAASMAPSKLGIKPGGRISVDQAIRAISVKSANDIAAALAEAIGGSEARFAQKMTARARSIGMSNTHFVNASGLHNRFQISTARDMAILARYIIVTYPRYYRYFGLRSFSYAGRSHPNHNKLMNTYMGMDGMKTGYISQSGYNLVASARRGDRRLIGVVLGGRTAKNRNDHMAKILDEAFEKPPRLAPPKIETARLSDYPALAAPGSISSVSITQPAGLQLVEPFPGTAPIIFPPAPSAYTPGRMVGNVAVPGRKPALAPAAGVLIVDERSDHSLQPSEPHTLGTLASRTTVETSGGKDRPYTAQIGAYQSREATDRALYLAMEKLPSNLRHAMPVVAPLKSVESGWLFRARLGNLNSAEAKQVCRMFKSCLVLSPERF